jgi:hypothetical protein
MLLTILFSWNEVSLDEIWLSRGDLEAQQAYVSIRFSSNYRRTLFDGSGVGFRG